MRVKQKLTMLLSMAIVSMLALVGVVGAQDDDSADDSPPPVLGITVVENENGAEVARVIRNYAADMAGIQRGDVITAVDGDAVTAEGLPDVLAGYAVGDVVTLTVERDGDTLAIDVTLGEAVERNLPGLRGDFRISGPVLGVGVNETDDGLVVESISPNSPAAEAGFEIGDIIVNIAGVEVTTLAEARRALAEAGFDGPVTLEVLRDGETLTLEIAFEPVKMREFAFPFVDELGLEYLEDENAWEITALSEDSPLAEAGLMVGDRITALNGERFDDMRMPMEIMRLLDTESITLTVERDGETLEIELDVAAAIGLFGANLPRMFEGRFGDMEPRFDFEMPRGGGEGFQMPEMFHFDSDRGYMGVTFVTLNTETAAEYAVETTEGALVIAVTEESPAAQAGIAEGDIITAVDGDTVDEERTLLDRIAAYEPEDVVMLTVEREGETLEIEVTLGAFDMRGEGFFGGSRGRFEFEHPPIPMEPPVIEETPEPSL